MPLQNRQKTKFRFREDLAPDAKYINRELSWLQFNFRVLEEANNEKHPLLERLNFLSISGSNLDEFYMVRVAGLRGQISSKINVKSTDGLTPKEQLDQINDLADDLMADQQKCWAKLKSEMLAANINVLDGTDVSEKDRNWLENYFLEEVFQVITPLAIDPAHPFPFIPNEGFCLILSLTRNSDKKQVSSLLPLPRQVPRFVRLPGNHIRFISLENLIILFLDQLFPGYTLNGKGVFRVIRDSEVEVDDEAEDLVRVFESALKRRRRGRVIRLQLNKDIPPNLRKMVVDELGATEKTVVEVDGILGICDTNQLIPPERHELLFSSYEPRHPERIKDFGGDIFGAIRAKDLLVHHPYESFDVVHDFLKAAAEDPKVLAIKQLLYRAGKDSRIINALITAAENGKSVTALIELKARFDEEQNIKWARDLERAGVQVVYGFMELKTHAKVSMVMRREQGGINTYCHFGTGNYHPNKAKIYTDLSFFTSDPALGRDASRLFNYVTGYIAPTNMEKIAMSPFSTRETLIRQIDNEIAHVKAGRPGTIWAKMNSLVDQSTIDKLYEASCAGVQIDLIVRGICCLKPGVKDLSENIRVKSIVGRFLEHARISCFGNGESLPSPKAVIYMSSADWMPRNFDWRVESLIPLENPTVHEQVLYQILLANLKDNQQSWTLNEKGEYSRVVCGPNDYPFNVHKYLMDNPSLSGRGAAIETEGKVRQLEMKNYRIGK